MRKFGLALILTLSAALPLAAHAEKSPQIKALGTVGMVSDVVSSVGGDALSLTTLIGPGLDPHLYKPTRTDMSAMLAADIVFYNGLLLEGKLTDALVKVASSGKKVIALTEGLAESSLKSAEDNSDHFDPHVWMDPTLWRETVAVVETNLTSALPNLKSQLAAAGMAYRQKLTELHEYSAKVLNSVPKESRVLVTAHDAFQYFGNRYGYEVVGIQGISTESEAGVKDIQRIVDMLVSRKIKAVFVESTVSERNIKALIEGAASRGHSVSIGGQLFSDAMGDAGTYEGTYIGMIDHNVTTIARALGGQAPSGGMSGKLSGVK